MSTASWNIDRETAEIIMWGYPQSEAYDLDRAWPSNWAIRRANQYEWCHIFDGGIECVACGLKHILSQDEEYHRRKVTWEATMGDVHEGLEFCTYEFTELMHCECGEVLGGWTDTCHLCNTLIDNYSRTDDPGRTLAGYIYHDTENDIMLNFDDTPARDIENEVDAICEECLFEHYEVDRTSRDPISHPFSDNNAWQLTKKSQPNLYEGDVKVAIEVTVILTGEGRNEKEVITSAENRANAMDLMEIEHWRLGGYGVVRGKSEMQNFRKIESKVE